MQDAEILKRLWSKKLDPTAFADVEGRIYLERISVEKPGRYFGSLSARAEWRNLHFESCRFNSIAFVGAHITSSVFSNCKMTGLGFWRSKVQECAFRNCDLSEVAFGGIATKRDPPNLFNGTLFEDCDLRGTSHSFERFSNCVFRSNNLSDVDFQGAVFEGCTFEGKVAAIFHRRSPTYDFQSTENLLTGCDFSRADVSDARFVNLDLDPSLFGDSRDVIPLRRGPEDWSEWAKQVDRSEFPGLDIFLREVSRCGAPSIASTAWLRDAGFSIADIERLKLIGSS